MSVVRLLAALLVLSSAQQIGLSTAAISVYNSSNITKDSKYMLSVIYLVLAIVGVLLGTIILIQNEPSIVMVAILLFIWLAVNVATGVVSQMVITGQTAGYVISYIITGLLFGMAVFTLI